MARTVTAARVEALLGSALDRSPAYLALADGLRLLISDGRIVPGTRLPSERELTARLAVSRTTVTRAYSHLRDRGYLTSRQGSGSVATLPTPEGDSRDAALIPGDGDDDVIDLTCAAPVSPPGVAAAYEAAAAEMPSYLGGTGYFPTGLPLLKEAIASRYAERGLPTTPDQIVVTTGALAAAAIAARAVVGVGDRVLVESPSYPNVLSTLSRSGARVLSAPVDPTGWDLAAFTGTLRRARPAAAYLIPDFQNPTGRLMPEEQRAELGAALSRSRTVALVDETMVDMALDAEQPMPPPLAAFAPDSITIGSASKAFWGGLRLGWLRAPDERVGALLSSRLSLDLGAPLFEQLVLTHLLRDRDRILTHHREQLVASRDALAEALRSRLPSWQFVLPTGGLALWCQLPQALSSALTAAAEAEQVLLAPGPAFAPEGGLESFLRIPYTKSPEALTAAVVRLEAAWDTAQRNRSAHGRRAPLIA